MPPTGNAHTRPWKKWRRRRARRVVIISAAIEAEVAQLPDEEAKEFLAALGLHEPGLDQLIRAGYELLDLITYFTVGPKETRAWTIHKGAKAPQAPASSTPISNVASSAPRPSPTTIS